MPNWPAVSTPIITQRAPATPTERVSTEVHINTHVLMNTYMHTYARTHTCIYIYIYIYVYKYTHMPNWPAVSTPISRSARLPHQPRASVHVYIQIPILTQSASA